MVSVSKGVLIVHALLAVPVQAARRGPGSELANSIFKNQEHLICGSGRIRDILTEKSSDARIRTLPWAKVNEVAKKWIKEQRYTIPKIEIEIARLREDIENAIEQESRGQMGKDEVLKLLQDSVESPKTFVSHDIAMKSLCGQSRNKKKLGVKIGAFHKSVDLFVEAATKKFTGQVRTTGEFVTGTCMEYYGFANGVQTDDETACDELCTQIGMEAGSLSVSTAGAFAGSSKKLNDELDIQLAMLKEAQSALEECTKSSEALTAFGSEIQGLDVKISEAFRLKNDASDALEAAEDEFEHGNDVQAKMEAVQAKAQSYHKQSEDELAKYTRALAAAREAEANGQIAVNEAQDAMEAARKYLKEASQATVDVFELRGLVSQTVMQMRLFYDSAVTNPIIAVGLTPATDLNRYFDDVSDALEENKETGNAIDTMSQYCETTAKPRFEKVKHIVDLSPLCEFGSVPEMKGHISKMVSTRKQEVIAHLEEVKKLLNPYHNNLAMDQAKSAELTAAGEPKGLREIVGIFGDTHYYRTYLKFWKYNAHPYSFVKVIEALGMHVEAVEDKIATLADKFAKAKQLYKDAIAQRKTAVWIQQLAVEHKTKADTDLKEANLNLATQQDLMGQAEKNLVVLEDALDRAEAAYRQAIKQLRASYHEGVAMLQTEATTEVEVKSHSQLN